MKLRKRIKLERAKAERKSPMGLMTSIADERVPNDFQPAIHKICCGGGEMDSYWRIALCFTCGTVPTGEMKAP